MCFCAADGNRCDRPGPCLICTGITNSSTRARSSEDAYHGIPTFALIFFQTFPQQDSISRFSRRGGNPAAQCFQTSRGGMSVPGLVSDCYQVVLKRVLVSISVHETFSPFLRFDSKHQLENTPIIPRLSLKFGVFFFSLSPSSAQNSSG